MSPNTLNSSTITIILMGTSLGLVHVLSGPDHLSALAALSNGIPYKAFSLGIRWGLGHAFGICITTMIIRAIHFNYMDDQAQIVIDCIVGLVMIIFGIYGIYQAISRYRKMKKRNKEKRISYYLEELSKEIARDSEEKNINDYDNTQLVYNYSEDEEFNSSCLLKSILSNSPGSSVQNCKYSQEISPKSIEKKLVLLPKSKEEDNLPNVRLPKVAKIIHKMNENKRKNSFKNTIVNINSSTKNNIISNNNNKDDDDTTKSSINISINNSCIKDTINDGNNDHNNIDIEEVISASDNDEEKNSIDELDQESIESPKIPQKNYKVFNIISKPYFSDTIQTNSTCSSSSPISPSSSPKDGQLDLSSFTSFYTVCITGLNKFFTVDIYNHETQKSASFIIGILHGASGPGVFLGLLPALKLSKFSASLIYLLSFTISSTLSMGIFSLGYTSITKCVSKRVGTDRVELFISLFSAFLSIFFGLFWFLTTILFPESFFNLNNYV